MGKSPPFGCFYYPQSVPRCPHSPLPSTVPPPWGGFRGSPSASLSSHSWSVLKPSPAPPSQSCLLGTEPLRHRDCAPTSPSQVRAYKGAGRETRPGTEQKVSLLLNFSVYFIFFSFTLVQANYSDGHLTWAKFCKVQTGMGCHLGSSLSRRCFLRLRLRLPAIADALKEFPDESVLLKGNVCES